MSVHLLVEAADESSLSRGLMGLAIRVARAVNRVLERDGASRSMLVRRVFHGLERTSRAGSPERSRGVRHRGPADLASVGRGWMRHGLIAPSERPREQL
jgi:hypothetical protein